jgi:hypothetical protein
MMEFTIPCEVFARLSNVLRDQKPGGNEWTKSIRVEDGCLVATNRYYMAVEKLDGLPAGVTHIVADPALIEQCRIETAFHSKLHILVNSLLNFTTIKTTMGYVYPGNGGIVSNAVNDLDRWRGVFPTELPTAPNGGLFLDLAAFQNLLDSSPSKQIVLPEMIDANKPCIVRDVNTAFWIGVFYPRKGSNERVAGATIPSWLPL